jgi:hypothetical protein
MTHSKLKLRKQFRNCWPLGYIFSIKSTSISFLQDEGTKEDGGGSYTRHGIKNAYPVGYNRDALARTE